MLEVQVFDKKLDYQKRRQLILFSAPATDADKIRCNSQSDQFFKLCLKRLKLSQGDIERYFVPGQIFFIDPCANRIEYWIAFWNFHSGDGNSLTSACLFNMGRYNICCPTTQKFLGACFSYSRRHLRITRLLAFLDGLSLYFRDKSGTYARRANPDLENIGEKLHGLRRTPLGCRQYFDKVFLCQVHRRFPPVCSHVSEYSTPV